jgi:hypothetical protein
VRIFDGALRKRFKIAGTTSLWNEIVALEEERSRNSLANAPAKQSPKLN